MWTPQQWSIAFPATAAAMVAACAAIAWGQYTHAPWVAGIGAGVIAGLCLSIAWTVRPLIGPLAVLHAFTALLALTSAWLATPRATLWASAVALVVIVSWVIGYHVVFTGGISRPVAREPESFGRGDNQRALIIFHPGRSEFQTRLQRTLAEAMAAKGWSVDLVTAHESAPTDARGYQLLVLGGPTYNFRPARAILDHLDRLTSLAGKPVALVLTGGGMTDEAMNVLRQRVQDKRARVILALPLWTARPNSERHGIDDPLEIVRRAAADLAAGLSSDSVRARA